MIRALVALALLASRPAFACTCDPKVVADLYAKPESAATALLGKAEGELFRVEASWTEYASAVALPRPSTCSLRPAPGQRLILLSVSPLAAFGEGKLSPSVCDSILLEPAKAEKAVRRLAPKENGGYHFGYNPSWGWCRADKDCVPTPGVCGGMDAVNVRSKAEHDAWRTRTAPRVNCISGVPPKNPSAKCIDSFCVVAQ
jgi:hypothetical protein